MRTCLLLLQLIIIYPSFAQNKLTAINPVTYTDVVFTSSGSNEVITAKLNGHIYTEDTKTKKRKLLAAVKDEVYDIEYSKKNGEIYLATYQSGILVLDAQTGKTKKRLPMQKWSNTVSISQDGTKLAAASIGDDITTPIVYVWDLQKNYQVDTLKRWKRLAGVKFSDNNQQLLVFNTGISLFDVRERKIAKHIPVGKGRINDLQLNNGTAAVVTIDGHGIIVNLETGALQHHIMHPDALMKFPSTGKYQDIPVKGAALTKCIINQLYLYTAGIDRTIRKWDIKNGQLLQSYKLHDATVSGIAIAEDGKKMASVSLSGELLFWDIASH